MLYTMNNEDRNAVINGKYNRGIIEEPTGTRANLCHMIGIGGPNKRVVERINSTNG